MRKIRFLSVSALNMFETQPNKFYMQRLAEDKLPRDPQNLAAAAGTAFDLEVKKYLIENNLLTAYNSPEIAESVIHNRFCKFPWPQPQNYERSLNDIFLDAIDEKNRIDDIFKIGKQLLYNYIKSNLFHSVHFQDIERKIIFNMRIKLSNSIIKVPIYAILDVVLKNGDWLYPMDLKVSGYGSGASPKPNYSRMYDGNGLPLNVEKWNKDSNLPFDEIDETWATQGCVYGWSIGLPLFEPFPFAIHAMFIGSPKKDGTRTIRTVGYTGIITVKFQKQVALRFSDAWNTVRGLKENVPWNKEALLCEMQSYNEKFGWTL